MSTPRVTDCEVKAIINTDIEKIRPYIIPADLMVTQYLGSKGLDDELLKEITRWLAAHLVAVNDQRLKSEKIGDATDQYHGETGMGLDFTAYGQQVKVLDPTGTFAAIGKRTAFFEVL